MRFPSRVAVAAALAFACAFAASPLPAAAQDSIQALSQQLERLQREVQVLQRQVATGQPSGNVEVPEGQAGPLLLRLNDLETELRQLTGRVEELSYGLDQVNGRMDRVEAQLETQVGAAGNTPQSTGDAQQSLMQGEQAGGGRVLGTMPENAAPQSEQPAGNAGSQQAAVPSVQLPGTSAKDDYDYAFGLLRQADYARAEAALTAFLEAHPNDQLAGNAKYWLGETHYVRGDYKTAAVVFAEGFKEYPESNKAPDNLLKLGMALSNVGERDDACKTYTALLARYPNAPATIRQRAEREQGRLGC